MKVYNCFVQKNECRAKDPLAVVKKECSEKAASLRKQAETMSVRRLRHASRKGDFHSGIVYLYVMEMSSSPCAPARDRQAGMPANSKWSTVKRTKHQSSALEHAVRPYAVKLQAEKIPKHGSLRRYGVVRHGPRRLR